MKKNSFHWKYMLVKKPKSLTAKTTPDKLVKTSTILLKKASTDTPYLTITN